MPGDLQTLLMKRRPSQTLSKHLQRGLVQAEQLKRMQAQETNMETMKVEEKMKAKVSSASLLKCLTCWKKNGKSGRTAPRLSGKSVGKNWRAD